MELSRFRYQTIIMPALGAPSSELHFEEKWILESATQLGLDYSQFLVVDKVSRYSSLLPNHIVQVREVMEKVARKIGNHETTIVVDATAHIGADSTIILSQIGSAATVVFPIEIDPKVFRILEKNCKAYPLIFPNGKSSVSFYPRFGSCVRELTLLPDAHLLYFDPPWGGTDYTEKDKVVLELGGIPVSEIIRVYLKSSPSTIVVCKQPRNFDEKEFRSRVSGSIEKYPIRKKNDVSYYLLVISSGPGDEPVVTQRRSRGSLFSFKGELESRFKRFISKNTGRDNFEGLWDVLMDQNLSDLDQLRMAKSITKPAPKGNQGRADSRVRQIIEIIQDVPKSPAYLDVGCSEGSITIALAKELRASRIAACDISDKAGKAFLDSPVKVEFKLNSPTTIPFGTSEFDVVTLNMCAHHFTHLEEMLREVKRVLKRGGLLILREHNRKSDEHAKFYDAIHCLYECVFGTESTPEEWVASYSPQTYAFYRSRLDWTETITDRGFEFINGYETGDYVDAFYAIFRRV